MFAGQEDNVLVTRTLFEEVLPALTPCLFGQGHADSQKLREVQEGLACILSVGQSEGYYLRATNVGRSQIVLESDFRPGLVLDNRYVLERLLGTGGMGEVWSARHLTLKKRVAVKLIRRRWTDDLNARKRFLREARTAAKLHLETPHTVAVVDHGYDGRLVYLVMELLHGRTLRELMRETTRAIALADVLKIFDEICLGVGEAHAAGIIHRDLKPGNIFISDRRPIWISKVMDFGAAKSVEPATDDTAELETQDGSVVGTPAYMSPERLSDGQSDVQADLWSLAIIGYELVIGQRPFKGHNLLSLLVNVATKAPPLPSQHGTVPDGFDDWFLRATSKEVGDRFASIEALSTSWKSVIGSATEDSAGVHICDLLQAAMAHDQAAAGDLTIVDSLETVNSPRGSRGPNSDLGTRETLCELERQQFTPIEVAEMQTQIQYRMIEQLREEHERSQRLLAEREEDTD